MPHHGPHPQEPRIGAALKRERTQIRRTLRDVATHLGISLQHLSDVERGVSNVPMVMYLRICGELGIKPGETLDRALEVTS